MMSLNNTKKSAIILPVIKDDDPKNDSTSNITENHENEYHQYNFAALDIIKNDEERESIEEDEEKQQKYNDEFRDFVNQYSKYYKQRRDLNEKNTLEFLKDKNSQLIRSSIRVLIIIGSSPTYNDLGCGINFYENSEDYTTAFLISHLFHYAFLIPYSQILITSSKEDVFIDKKTKTKYQEMDEKTKKSKMFDVSFKILLNNFGFFQKVNYSQVGKYQHKFLLESSLLKRIKPFNSDIIIHELNPDEKSDIFLFFIDHSSQNIFGGLDYQFYIDELIKIKFNHFYVMNDSYYSGSLIEIIKNCIDFEYIFSNNLDADFEYDLLQYLFEFGNEISDVIIDEKQQKVRDFLQNISTEQTSKLNEFINNISIIFPTGIKAFIPKNFVIFGEKATIFSSSDYESISLSLPGRKITVSLFDNYRVCGSIFSSIFIESLLKKNISLETFQSSIKELFQKYKNDFEDIIMNQNKNLTEGIPNPNLLTNKQIIQFFNMNDFDNKHFFSMSNQWPNLGSILITNENFWNVETSKVDVHEYESVFFCNLKKESTISENLDNYGPIKGISSILKFQNDFEKAVNKILKEENSENTTFSVSQTTENESKKLWFGNWAKFVISIQPYITSKSGYAISTLRLPIAIFFYDYPNYDKEKGLKMFINAFQAIYPFWKDQSLYN